MEYYFRLDILD